MQDPYHFTEPEAFTKADQKTTPSAIGCRANASAGLQLACVSASNDDGLALRKAHQT